MYLSISNVEEKSYCMELGDEDLLRYSNKIESVGLRKYPHPLVIAMVTRVMTLTF